MSTPDKLSAWLFPGQGSQSVGMAAKLMKDYPPAFQILKLAEEISHQPLIEAIRRGPDSLLTRSEIVQPAIVALSCGYIDLMKQSHMEPDFVAGHSLGELSALYAAQVIDMEHTLKLASERGRLMSSGASGGMIAVRHCNIATLDTLIDTLQEGTVCLANFNAPSQIVLSGDEEGLAAISAKIRDAGGQCVRLNVSGAWHSPLVAVAACAFEKELQRVLFRDPKCPVAMSSTAKLVYDGSSIQQTMLKQMVSPVRWYETIDLLRANSVFNFFEVGCGKVLKGLMRRILPDEASYDIQCMESGRLWSDLIAHGTHDLTKSEPCA